MSNPDYTQIPLPNYTFGNSQDIHNAILTGLVTDSTDPTNSNYALANYNGQQYISTEHHFTNGVHSGADPTLTSHLARKNYVDNQISNLSNNFVDLTTSGQECTVNKVFDTVHVPTLLNINPSATLNLLGSITASSITISPNELSCVNGATSNLQSQINNKQASLTSSTDISIRNLTTSGTGAFYGNVSTAQNLNSNGIFTANGYLNCNNNVFINSNVISNSATITPSQLGYLSGVTSAVQTQLNSKINSSNAVDLSSNQTITGTKTIGNLITTTQTQGDNSLKVASTSYVDTAVSNLIGSAPSLLNTLQEIDTALNNDPNFNTTITTLISTKATDSAVVHLTNNETIGGVKTFSTAPIFSGANISSATITDGALSSTFLKASQDFTSGNITLATNKTISGINATTMSYLDATSSIQTQLNSKQATITNGSIGDSLLSSSFLKASQDFTSGNITLDTNKTISGINATKMSYLTNVTSDIQAQINSVSGGGGGSLTSTNTYTGLNTFNNGLTVGNSSALTVNTGSIISLPNGSLNISTINANLCTTDTTQTISGFKTFNVAPNVSGANIMTGTINDGSLVSTFLKASTDFTSGNITLDTNKTISGVNSTTMGYLDATSSIQTQLNSKQSTLTSGSVGDSLLSSTFVKPSTAPVLTGTNFTSIPDGALSSTFLKASTDFTSGNITLASTKTISGVNATTMGYLDATSSIQTQLNGKYTMPSGTNIGNFIYYNGSSWGASSDGKIRMGSNAGSSSQGTSSICIGTSICSTASNASNNAGPNNILIGQNVGAGVNATMATDIIAIGNNAVNQAAGTYAIAVGSGAGYQSLGSNAIAIGQQALRVGSSKANCIALGNNAMYWGANTGSIAIGLSAATTSTTGLATVCIGQECGYYSNLGDYAIGIGYRCGYATNALPANSITLNASGAALNPTTTSAFYVNPVRNDTSTSNNICFYNTTTHEISYNSTIPTSAIASGALTITSLSCSSETDSGSLSTALFREIINTIGNNGTTNNFTLNMSSGDFFCLTSNAPNANFTVKLVNCGTDATKTIKFTLMTNTAYYCNTITAYSDNGITQITLSSSTPLFVGTPSIGSATVVSQTFTLIKSFSSNYCLSDVYGYA